MSATRSLFERRDVIIVASVSCIYGIGSPEAYYGMMLMLEKGPVHQRAKPCCASSSTSSTTAPKICAAARSACAATRIEIYPPYEDYAVRVELWGSQIDAIRQIDPLTGEIRSRENEIDAAADLSEDRTTSCPPSRESAPSRRSTRSSTGGRRSSSGREKSSRRSASWQRTLFDIEMMRTIGYCHGIENYSRHLSGRLPGEAPPTLLDYVPSGLSAVRRRIAPDGSATARHVSRRPLAQADARRITVSACRRRSTIAR